MTATVAALALGAAAPASGAVPQRNGAPEHVQAALDAEYESGWGFNALLWQETRPDPNGYWRFYYYQKCDPERGKRFMKMETHWGIWTTYQCWAILA